MLNNTILLLTATVDVKGVAFSSRNDISLRLNDYLLALEYWLKYSPFSKIVFCENSGYDLDPLILLAKKYDNKSVEFLSFNAQDFPREYGKGYGEFLTIRYFLENSKIININDTIVKVNGRYVIKNIQNVICGRVGVNNICGDISKRLRWVDSRCFTGDVEFYKNYLLPKLITVNDSQGRFFEHALSDAFLTAIIAGYNFNYYRTSPKIDGVSGSNNCSYNNDILRHLKRNILLCAKKIAFSI